MKHAWINEIHAKNRDFVFYDQYIYWCERICVKIQKLKSQRNDSISKIVKFL